MPSTATIGTNTPTASVSFLHYFTSHWVVIVLGTIFVIGTFILMSWGYKHGPTQEVKDAALILPEHIRDRRPQSLFVELEEGNIYNTPRKYESPDDIVPRSSILSRFRRIFSGTKAIERKYDLEAQPGMLEVIPAASVNAIVRPVVELVSAVSLPPTAFIKSDVSKEADSAAHLKGVPGSPTRRSSLQCPPQALLPSNRMITPISSASDTRMVTSSHTRRASSAGPPVSSVMPPRKEKSIVAAAPCGLTPSRSPLNQSGHVRKANATTTPSRVVTPIRPHASERAASDSGSRRVSSVRPPVDSATPIRRERTVAAVTRVPSSARPQLMQSRPKPNGTPVRQTNARSRDPSFSHQQLVQSGSKKSTGTPARPTAARPSVPSLSQRQLVQSVSKKKATDNLAPSRPTTVRQRVDPSSGRMSASTRTLSHKPAHSRSDNAVPDPSRRPFRDLSNGARYTQTSSASQNSVAFR